MIQGSLKSENLHDRLGSVRQIIDTSGNVKNHYTYKSFGELFATEVTENVLNPFKFSGQFFDDEIDEYYLRARMYDPHIGRFTSRDPLSLAGVFEEPLTLHRYLYCQNDPINGTDPLGLWTIHVTGTVMGSCGWSGVRQSGIVFDDKGNWGWLNVSGIGSGSPQLSAGFTVGATSAETIFELREWGCSVGGSASLEPLGLPFISLGPDVIIGRKFWGVQATIAASIPKWIPFEIHGHVTETGAYSFREIFESVNAIVEARMPEVQTLGEAYAILSVWGLLGSLEYR